MRDTVQEVMLEVTLIMMKPQGQAILQLAQIGLQFDESKSNNPFAYYTAAVTNSFENY